MSLVKVLVLLSSIGLLSGCALATIPLNIAAANAMTDNTMSKAEEIPRMNCSQLRARWQELSSPLAAMNPFRAYGAERSLVRQYASQRGCRL